MTRLKGIKDLLQRDDVLGLLVDSLRGAEAAALRSEPQPSWRRAVATLQTLPQGTDLEDDGVGTLAQLLDDVVLAKDVLRGVGAGGQSWPERDKQR